MDVAPPRELLQPINVPRKTMTGPGPSNMSPRVEAAAGLCPMGTFQLHPENRQIFDEVRLGIQYVFQTKNPITLCVSGCAHSAVEAICFNVLEPGETALVVCNGLWGERFAEMASRQGIQVEKFEKPQGQIFTLGEIEEKLNKVKPVLTFIAYGESTGGTLQPLEGLGPLCHKYGSLLVIDGVASVGGAPMFMDRWEIDVLYTGSQKVLSAIPGITPISFSERSWNRIQNRKTKVRTYLNDIQLLAGVWGCLPNHPRGYHHTPAMGILYALREALAIVAEEGLENVWRRQLACTAQLHAGIQELGLELLVKEPAHRLPVVSAIVVPPGIDWLAVSNYAMSRYKVEISGSLGVNSGSIWRIGIMGHNARPEIVQFVLKVFSEGLQHVRQQMAPPKL